MTYKALLSLLEPHPEYSKLFIYFQSFSLWHVYDFLPMHYKELIVYAINRVHKSQITTSVKGADLEQRIKKLANAVSSLSHGLVKELLAMCRDVFHVEYCGLSPDETSVLKQNGFTCTRPEPSFGRFVRIGYKLYYGCTLAKGYLTQQYIVKTSGGYVVQNNYSSFGQYKTVSQPQHFFKDFDDLVSYLGLRPRS